MKSEPPDRRAVNISNLEAPALSAAFVAVPESSPENYWSIVARQFSKNKVAVIALAIVLALFALAIFADFIANDKPLVMSYKGTLYFPILKDYSVWLRLSKWQPQFLNIQFKEFVTQNATDVGLAVFPIVRYSPTEIEL